MDKKFPAGSVQGLCTASATMFSLGIAFLGIWGFSGEAEKTAWAPIHLWVLMPMGVSFSFLALTPWVATAPCVDEQQSPSFATARRCFQVGAISALVTVLAAVLVAIHEERKERLAEGAGPSKEIPASPKPTPKYAPKPFK